MSWRCACSNFSSQEVWCPPFPLLAETPTVGAAVVTAAVSATAQQTASLRMVPPGAVGVPPR